MSPHFACLSLFLLCALSLVVNCSRSPLILQEQLSRATSVLERMQETLGIMHQVAQMTQATRQQVNATLHHNLALMTSIGNLAPRLEARLGKLAEKAVNLRFRQCYLLELKKAKDAEIHRQATLQDNRVFRRKHVKIRLIPDSQNPREGKMRFVELLSTTDPLEGLMAAAAMAEEDPNVLANQAMDAMGIPTSLAALREALLGLIPAILKIPAMPCPLGV